MTENEEFEFRHRLEQEQTQQPDIKMGGSPPIGAVAKQVFGMLPQVKLAESPENLLPMAGAALGTVLAPGLGTAAGAGLGQIGNRMIQIAKGSPVQSPGREAVAPMVQAFMGGIPEVAGIVPKWMGGNPGSATVAQKVGQGLAKAGETMSGAKKDILSDAYKQGYSTYQAPTMEQAKTAFGKAIGPKGEAALKPTAEDAFDAALGKARGMATEIGTKLERFLSGSGEPPTALEALQARQATDRIISATTPTDKDTLGVLYGWRKQFDDLMTSQSDALAGASKQYRQAIVRDTLLEPTRITKSGRPSSFLPMIMGAGGRGVEGTAGMMTGTSPAVWGLGATTAGQISKISLPVRNAALAAFIDKVTEGKQ